MSEVQIGGDKDEEREEDYTEMRTTNLLRHIVFNDEKEIWGATELCLQIL